MSPLTEPTRIILRNGWQPMDPDAAAYIAAVETADGQALEEPVKIAIDNFVLGCKADGIWDAIKASCILAGARTLSGALVPLAGTAPTNFNFVAGDYNRKTGLVGNGSTKYLDSNRNNNADPQDNRHIAVMANAPDTANKALVSARVTSTGATFLWHANLYACANGANTEESASASMPLNTLTFKAVSRDNSAGYTIRVAGSNYAVVRSSGAPLSSNYTVFCNLNNTLFSNARIAFYSIGEALDLALLDGRVTDLITAFGAAIP